jgi:V/A-type H+-transporting ATPase subunit A
MRGEDVFCKPEKQYWLLKLMIDFFERAYELVKGRVPVEEIARIPEVYEMQRVKEDERGLEAVKELYGRVMGRLEELASKYGLRAGGRA